ncbi:hypothetical protein [Rhodanobacter sp. MP1X3]|uniref:hypothetical protein n=1 Tax=Rhodanobacter sp. MP1X3 TaxID=2723086 RepID=UPI00160A528B|nr:hypothetical protein [Rhodanobacter sp. MP1X3]MBB6244679.1 hypothetical protein [Rhodanobacter sp. MP1X3]
MLIKSIAFCAIATVSVAVARANEHLTVNALQSHSARRLANENYANRFQLTAAPAPRAPRRNNRQFNMLEG